MQQYTVDETMRLGDEIKLQIVAFVGDYERTVCTLLSRQLAGSELDYLRLDNRYYHTKVGIEHFRSADELAGWDMKQKSEAEIGVLIVRYNCKNDLECLQKSLHLYQCDVQALVLDDEANDPDGFALQWATENEFEVVYLNPDQANREEAASFNEKCGAARLAEMLHTANWPFKHHKMENITGKENVDRILQLVNQMDFSSESEIEPDDNDKEAIWTAFTAAVSNSPPPEDDENESSSTTNCCEANISVDVVLNNTKKSSATTTHQPSEDATKKKKKKNKKAKSDAEPSLDEFTLSAESTELIDKMIASVEDGTADQTIGDLTKVRNEIAAMQFNNKARIDKAEAIVRGIAEAMNVTFSESE